MFGYVRAFRPYLRVCEDETYKAVYCGLCKTMGRLTGQTSRLALSYDFTFLALLDMAVNQIPVRAEKECCIAHPTKKRLIVKNRRGLEYSAYAAAILVYHKLRDDAYDKDAKSRAAARLILPIAVSGYKKAKGRYPSLARKIEYQMKRQRRIEAVNCDSIDIACDPTAKIMQAIAAEISDDIQTKEKLRRFGYALGRFIYLTDALDDVRKNAENGDYNPLLKIGGVDDRVISDEQMTSIRDFCTLSVNLTLGELADSYMALDLKMYRDILDNIIYVGLKNVYSLVKAEKFKAGLRKES